MKIELEIPDWVEKEARGIHIMAGIERVAYWLPWEKKWHIKTSRCSSCGKCCERMKCPFLNEDKQCSKGIERPWLCCISEPKSVPKCTSKYN
jgi:TPP-dependent indolepyruvate ferredoxin oxidoreductase alpha subunit